MLTPLADNVSFSWDLLADLQMLLHYHFMQNAYLAGTLVALAAGSIGYFMVLRNQSFAGHSLANVGFAGATGAALFGITPIVGLFIAGLLAALGIQALTSATRQNRQSDIAVGAVFTASLALGFLFIHLSKAEYAANVYNVLFGNVLGISDANVEVIAWSTLLLVGILLFIARPLFFASVDADVAAAHRVPVRALSFAYLVLLALEVAIAVQVVGVLLIFALLVTPAAIANYMTTRPVMAVLIAIVLALLFTWAGLAVGYVTPYPVGFFITTFAFGTYLLVRGGYLVRASWLHRLPHSPVGGQYERYHSGRAAPFTLNLGQDIQAILSYDFMRQGLLAGTILSIVAGLVGYFVVLRHQAFAGEALSDVAFTGALGGAALGINPFLSLIVTTVVVALAMGSFGERLRERDVAIGTVLAWVLGLGVLFLSLFTAHVSGTGTGFSGVTVLFGNILGTSADQVRSIALISGIAILVLLVIARPLLFASLDPDVAVARGVPVRLLSLGFMVLLAITVSEATLAVGALLVFALLLLPAAIAQQVVNRPFVGLGLAAGFAVIFTWLGIAIGFYTGYPSSVCISLLAFVIYVLIRPMRSSLVRVRRLLQFGRYEQTF